MPANKRRSPTREATPASSSMSATPSSTITTNAPGGSLYITDYGDVSAIHIWGQPRMNENPATCSHCSEILLSELSKNSIAPESENATESVAGDASEIIDRDVATIQTQGTAQTGHLCNRRDAEINEVARRFVQGTGTFRYEGIELPTTKLALAAIWHGELNNWRKEANVIWRLSKNSAAWHATREERAIEAFAAKILRYDYVTRNPELDGLVIGYVLRDIPLNDPLSSKLEGKLLTPQAAAAQDLLRARLREAQVAHLSTSSAAKGAFDEDETGFRKP
jgi:hypothetical protein